MSNFQDFVELRSDTLVHRGAAVAIGTAAGAKSIIFSNDQAAAHLVANPGGNTTINLLAVISAINISAGAAANNLSAVVFSNSNNVSFGLNGSTVTASVTIATSLSNIRVSAGTTSNLLSAITFANGNNVSFGIDASTITASVATSLTNIRVSGGTTSNLLSAITFSNSNNVSFGLDGSTMTATATFAQSNQQMTLFATGNTTQSSTGTTNASSLIFRGEGAASVGITNGSIVISSPVGGVNVAAYGVSNLGNSAGDTGTRTGTMVFVGSNHITLSQATGAASNTITVLGRDAVFGLGVSNGGNTAGDTGTRTGVVVFAGGAGIIASQATGANSNTISIVNSWSTATTASQVGAANVVGLNQGRFALEGHQHAGVAAAGVSNVGNTGGNTGTRFGTIVFAGGNHITMSQATVADASQITISAVGRDAVFGAGVSNVGNTAGDTGTRTGTIVFAGAGAVTLSQATGANSNTISISVPTQSNQQMTMFATGNTTQSSTGTTNASSLIFRGDGVASVGITNGSVVISVPAGGGGLTNINVSAGTTSNNLSAITFSNSNGVSFGINGSTITASVNAGGGGIMLSSYENIVPIAPNGSMIGQSVNQSTSNAVFFNLPQSISASFIRLPVAMTNNQTTNATTAASINASMEMRSTWNAVIYSIGTGASSQSLMSVSSTSQTCMARNSLSAAAAGSQYSQSWQLTMQVEGNQFTFSTSTQRSTSNYSWSSGHYSILSGSRWFDLNFAGSLPPGNYCLIFGLSTSVATNSTGVSGASNCFVRYTSHYVVTQYTTHFGVIGQTNLTSNGLGGGSFTTAGGGTTAALPLSAISSMQSNRRVYFQMLRSA